MRARASARRRETKPRAPALARRPKRAGEFRAALTTMLNMGLYTDFDKKLTYYKRSPLLWGLCTYAPAMIVCGTMLGSVALLAWCQQRQAGSRSGVDSGRQ